VGPEWALWMVCGSPPTDRATVGAGLVLNTAGPTWYLRTDRLMFRTIDRYLIRQVLPPFFLALLVLTFLLEIPPVMRTAEPLIAKGVAWSDIARIMVTLLPSALGLTIPMSFLVGLLIGLGRLSADRETVALQACGVSIYRLLRPVALLAVLTMTADLYVMIVAIPDANQTFREITYRIITERAESDIKPRVFFEDFPNRVLYVRDVSPGGDGWLDVFLADTTQPDQPQIFVARRGDLELDPVKRRVALVLHDGTVHKTNLRNPVPYDVQRFGTIVISLDPDTVFRREGLQRGDAELSIGQLQEQIVELRALGKSTHAPIMRIHMKFSIPVACVVFAIIGLALGVTSRKEGKLGSFVLGTGVIFAYYIVMYLGESLAKAKIIPPPMAMWIPNILLGTAGILLLVWRSSSVERRVSVPLPFRRRAAADAGAAPATAPGVTPAPAGKRVVVVIRIPQLSVPRPNLLDGYVARMYLKIIAVAFVGMLGIFYISTFIDLSDKLFKGQTTGAMILRYMWWTTPQYIYFVLPISALVATLVTIGILTKTSELVVMKACGISLYRAAAPLLVLSLAWSGVLFTLEESLLAHANRQAQALRHVIRGGSPQTFNVLNRKWLVGRSGEIYNYLFFAPERQELNGISIYEFGPGGGALVRRTFATRAVYGSAWIAQDGWVREFTTTRNVLPAGRHQPFATKPLALEPPSYFVTEQPDAERMTYVELKRHIEDLRASGFNVTSLLVDQYRKIAFPFVTVVMTLLAVPFAVTTGRGGALYGIGAGLGLAMTYWIINSVFAAIGSAGMVAPMLAAWAPNVMFAASAVYLLLRVRT